MHHLHVPAAYPLTAETNEEILSWHGYLCQILKIYIPREKIYITGVGLWRYNERRKTKVIELFFIVGIIACYQITRLSIPSSSRVDRELNHTLYQKLRSTGQQLWRTRRRGYYYFFFQILHTILLFHWINDYISLWTESLDPGQFSGILIYSTVH